MNDFLKFLIKHKLVSDTLAKMPTAKQLFFSAFGSVVLLFMFISFLSYNPSDPAWSHVGGNEAVTNIGGRLGAWFADILHVFFGWGVWWLVVVMAYELVMIWWRQLQTMWQLRVMAYGFLLVCLSAFLAGLSVAGGTDSAIATTISPQALKMGGVLGFELFRSLTEVFGSVMSAFFLVIIIVFVLVLAFEIGFGKMADKVIGWLDNSPNTDDKKPKTDDEALFDVIDHQEARPNAPKTASNASDEGGLEEFLAESGIRESLREELAEQEQDKKTDEPKALTKEEKTVIKAEINPEPKPVPTPKKETKPIIVRHDVPQADEADDDEDVFVYQNKKTNQSISIQREHLSDALDDLTKQANKEPLPEKNTDESESKPTQPTLFDDVNPKKSRAMDTLAYRMSLSPIPELSILDKPDADKQPSYTDEELQELSELLEIKLKEFNIKAEVVSAMVGPVVTRFEVALAAGVKASRVTGASQDLARSLSMASLRVVEVIPGKPYIGIEIPNRRREMVRLIELLDTPDYKNPDNQIAIAIGKDIGGKVVIADLAKAPHMLVAGTTGSGKSVLVNSVLLSMLLKYSPDELKLVLIDPKQLELANYADIPHLLTPVITDMTDATASLTWCVGEMERRYQLMSLLRVRKISEFNKKVKQAEEAGEPILDPLWRADENVSIKTAPKLRPLPLIVIVADEFADMIMQLGKTAEEPIVRLAQKARAAGIHLVLATQRPTVNVVTGLIKANVPSRVALRVNSKVDSRTIIEEGGAENMLGNGDMMFIGPGKNTPERVHGAYVDDNEVNRVCDAWRERGKPDYIDLSSSYTFEGEGSGNGGSSGADDEYYHQAVTFVMESRKVSISSIQRKLGIGYNRAARIVDMMEEAGLVSPMDSSGKRQLLM